MSLLQQISILVAMVIGVASLILGVVGHRQKAGHDRIGLLREEVEDLEKDLDYCNREREKLSKENIAYMREIIKLENLLRDAKRNNGN